MCSSDLNNSYLLPLTQTFPAHRKGPEGDVAKINCATCHQGVYKPYFGQSMAKDYPELRGRKTPAAEAAAAPAAPAAAPAKTATSSPGKASNVIAQATAAASGDRL